MNDMILLDITGLDPNKPIFDLRLEIDGGDLATDGAFEECDEENNSHTWGQTVCLP